MAIYSLVLSPLLDSRLPLWPSHVWILTISSVQPASGTPAPSYSTCGLFIPSRLLQRTQRGSTDLCVHDNTQATRSVCCSLFALVAGGEEIKASASGNSRDVQESNSGKPLNDNVPFFVCSRCRWMRFWMQHVLCFALRAGNFARSNWSTEIHYVTRNAGGFVITRQGRYKEFPDEMYLKVSFCLILKFVKQKTLWEK